MLILMKEVDIKNSEVRLSIKAFMQRHNLSAFAWAKKAKVSDNALRNFLKGKTDSVTTKLLEKLAKAENVTVSEILRTSNVEKFSLHEQIYPDVLKMAIEEAGKAIEKHKIQLSAKEYADYILELCGYGQKELDKTGKPSIPSTFAEWILNKNKQKS